MSQTVGILAYGSLISSPGTEIEEATARILEGIETPFNVEFARKSSRRRGAPTLVPVESAGSPVAAKIFVVDLSLEEAANVLYRRERNEVGSGLAYREPTHVTPNTVLIKKLTDFGGMDIFIYTQIGANIEPLTAEKLAALAIGSARTLSDGRDGITYLINALANGIRTPLSHAYKKAIMRQMGAVSLPEALSIARGAQDKVR